MTAIHSIVVTTSKPTVPKLLIYLCATRCIYTAWKTMFRGISNAENIKLAFLKLEWCAHIDGRIHTTQTQTTITTQLSEKPWRRPLTMGHQQTEMTAQYTGELEAISRVIPHSGNPQLPTLADHFSDGPTKVKTSYIFNSHVGNAIQNYCIKLISLCIYWASIFRILYCTPPIQELTPSTVNKSVQGRRFVPQNQAVLDRTEPYMTTNNW